MTTLALRYEASSHAPDTARAAKPDTSRGLFQRFEAMLFAAQARRADRAIARLIAQNGGLLTDDLERRISREYCRIVGM